MPKNTGKKNKSTIQRPEYNELQIKKHIYRQISDNNSQKIDGNLSDVKTGQIEESKNYVQLINLIEPPKKIPIQLKLIKDAKTKQIKQINDYTHITQNIYVDMPKPKTLAMSKWPECEYCNGERHCCLGCEMYAADMECHRQAHNGIDCGNQRIQRKQFAKTYIASAGDRGRGLFCGQKLIRPGSLITEYVGEIISENTLFTRLNKEHFYGVFLGKKKDLTGTKLNFYIDSSLKGNEARFANHSCDPNAEARFVYIGNEKRVGLFAIKQIREGDEITFDYRLETLSENPIKCLCGASNCTGVIGKVK